MEDLRKIKKINIKKEKKDRVGLDYSELVLFFDKDEIDNTILNTIRRIIHDFTPVYAVGVNNVVIDKNTGYQNNDQIKLRLSQFPILIKPDIIYYNKDDQEEYNKKEIEIYFNVLNNSHEMKAVTSNEFRILINGKEVKNFYSDKYPLLLTILRSGEEIIGKCNAVLGIGKNGNQWEPCYKTFYIEDGNQYKMTIHSYGQYSEEELFVNACDIIKHETNLLKENIIEILNEDKYKNDINEFEISFNDKTISNLLNSRLQHHKYIKFSGIYIPNMLDKKVVIKVEKHDGDFKRIITECCDEICGYIDVLKNGLK